MKKIIITMLCILLVLGTTSMSSCGRIRTEKVSITETRQYVEAIENQDYHIDKITVAVSDSKDQNGNVEYIDFSKLRSLLETKKELGKEVHCRVTVKYTALKELAGASCKFHLNFWSFQGDNHREIFSGSNGNQISNQTNYLLKTYNISPGTHYIYFSFSIPSVSQDKYNPSVIENLDTIDEELQLVAYVYVNQGEQQ